ncbi:expressed unknown protein [Seminavis robusta]|uniref:Uncharacterized protein n=1 Tax=Seminavis robusta TaxID=568900 RepID=A0A9N8DRB2_9STRA|nr:expressed unknown protein [Seminavis robusta]|eukprot:Sro315_g115200.1 n/a (203) ;mRNA; r:5368-5976
MDTAFNTAEFCQGLFDETWGVVCSANCQVKHLAESLQDITTMSLDGEEMFCGPLANFNVHEPCNLWESSTTLLPQCALWCLMEDLEARVMVLDALLDGAYNPEEGITIEGMAQFCHRDAIESYDFGGYCDNAAASDELPQGAVCGVYWEASELNRTLTQTIDAAWAAQDFEESASLQGFSVFFSGGLAVTSMIFHLFHSRRE